MATQQIGYYHAPAQRCVRMGEMQGAEDEGAGSVLKYMTKPESDGNAADWLLSRADHFNEPPPTLARIRAQRYKI